MLQEELLQNDKEHLMLRRCQNTLSVVGAGIIVFAVWSVVRSIGTLLLAREQTVIASVLEDPELQVIYTGPQLKIFLTVVMLLTMLMDVGMRLYVGFSARAVARGKKRSALYLVFTGIMICGSVGIVILVIAAVAMGVSPAGEGFITPCIIELTSVAMMIEMLAAGIRIRQFTGSGKHSIQIRE